MKNRNSQLLLCFFVLMMLAFTSCKKENSVTLETEEKPIETKVEMIVNGRMITTNAYAEYCISSSGEFLAVSNKQVLLDTVMNLTDFAEDDFVFHYKVDSLYTYTLGGAVFGPSTTGVPGLLQVIFDVSPIITIDSNNGTIVDGSMTGNFLVLDSTLLPSKFLPYSANFSALIVQQSVFCD